MTWASAGSVIGSGWLFGALLVTEIAGPSGILAWGIASVLLVFIALVIAELGGLLPVTGGLSRFPHYSFGSFAGGTFGWMSYIQAATVAPIEVLATIQYFTTVSWASSWYKPSTNTLSGTGIGIAVLLMAFFVVVNLYGIKWFARLNNSVTTWKVFVPVLAIIWLMTTHFHSGNLTGGGGFFVHPGGAGRNIIGAIVPGGVIFSLLGFEQAAQLAGESSNPQRDIPRAVIGGMAIGAVVYILAQLAFVVALKPDLLVHFHSWAGLAKDGPLAASPYYTLAGLAGLGFLANILRVDAVISPGGTGLVYMTATSRLSYGLSKNGYIPAIFEKESRRTRIPWFGVILTAIIGLLFLLPFPSWSSLVGIVTGASVLMYAGAPLALGAFRKTHPDLPRPYRLPYAAVLAPLGFVIASVIVYWSGWGVYSTLMIVIVLGYLLMLLSGVFKLNPHTPKIDWGAAWWILPYLVGLGILSYLGNFPSGGVGIINGVGVFKNVLVGAHGHLPFWYDLGIVAAFSLVIYFVAVAMSLPRQQMDKYMEDVYPPSEALH
ncbi:MAG TPA: APC family permease [Acidimicrobiales bacterium]|nr:APC family permease [Acidimicrobiales bacterium]